MSPTVLIAAPVRNRAKHLPHYLKALASLDYPKDQISFFFLLNDSKDASDSLLKEFQASTPRVVVETMNLGTPEDVIKSEGYRSASRLNLDTKGKPKAQGVYKALAILRNRVLDQFQALGSDYLLSVDTDIYVQPNLLKRLISHQKDMVAAMISNFPKRLCPNAMIQKRGPGGRMVWHRFEPPPQKGVYEVHLTGAVCLHSRKVLGCKYAWDPNGEDTPFCAQVRAKGLKLWLDTTYLAEHHLV